MRTATAALFVTLAFATACTCASDAPPDAPAVKKTAKKIENPAVAERRAKQLDRLRKGKKEGSKGGKRSKAAAGLNPLATVSSNFQVTPERVGPISASQIYTPGELSKLFDGYKIEEGEFEGGRRMVISAGANTEVEIYADKMNGDISEVHLLSDDYVTGSGARVGLMLGRARRASRKVTCALGSGAVAGSVVCGSEKTPGESVVVQSDEGPVTTLPSDEILDGWRVRRLIWKPVEPSKQ